MNLLSASLLALFIWISGIIVMHLALSDSQTVRERVFKCLSYLKSNIFYVVYIIVIGSLISVGIFNALSMNQDKDNKEEHWTRICNNTYIFSDIKKTDNNMILVNVQYPRAYRYGVWQDCSLEAKYKALNLYNIKKGTMLVVESYYYDKDGNLLNDYQSSMNDGIKEHPESYGYLLETIPPASTEESRIVQYLQINY